MESNLIPIKDVAEFQWKDQKGVFHPPSLMTTSHLFNTLLMIWNHVVPEEMKVRPYRRYRFSSFYTKEYILKAITALRKELGTRRGLTPRQSEVLLLTGSKKLIAQ